MNYYVLAALGGVAEIDAARCSAEDRKRVLAELLTILRNTNDIRAQRASLTLKQFAGERDTLQVIALLEHPDKTVRHNLRVWLFRTLRDRGVETFAKAVRNSGLRPEAQREVLADFKDYVADPEGAEYTGSLFAYIPNLREVKPSTWKRLAPALAPQPKAGPAPGDRKGPAEDPGAQTAEGFDGAAQGPGGQCPPASRGGPGQGKEGVRGAGPGQDAPGQGREGARCGPRGAGADRAQVVRRPGRCPDAVPKRPAALPP